MLILVCSSNPGCNYFFYLYNIGNKGKGVGVDDGGGRTRRIIPGPGSGLPLDCFPVDAMFQEVTGQICYYSCQLHTAGQIANDDYISKTTTDSRETNKCINITQVS